MITLEKVKDKAHEITNDSGVVSVAAKPGSDVEGFTPVDYLASSVSICIGLTLDALIARDQLDVEGYTIKIICNKAEGRPSRFESMDVEVKFNGELDSEVKEKLLKSAKRACTIGHTIEHGAEINLAVE